jgi:hypothetical protein
LPARAPARLYAHYEGAVGRFLRALEACSRSDAGEAAAQGRGGGRSLGYALGRGDGSDTESRPERGRRRDGKAGEEAGGGGAGYRPGCPALVQRHFEGMVWRNKYFYNNFEVVRLADFRPGSAYYRWFAHVDGDGGIFRSRWGDAPIRTLGVLFLFEPKQVLDLSGKIDYMHPPLITCAAMPETAHGRQGAHGVDAAFSFLMELRSCCAATASSQCRAAQAGQGGGEGASEGGAAQHEGAREGSEHDGDGRAQGGGAAWATWEECEARPKPDLCRQCALVPQASAGAGLPASELPTNKLRCRVRKVEAGAGLAGAKSCSDGEGESRGCRTLQEEKREDRSGDGGDGSSGRAAGVDGAANAGGGARSIRSIGGAGGDADEDAEAWAYAFGLSLTAVYRLVRPGHETSK